MRIAQVAPLWEPVPPATYGGTELVVYNLTEELVRRGHEVTLFACGGTTTSAKLVECSPMPLRAMEEQIKMDKTHCTVMAYELKMLQTVFDQAEQFDVIHNHVGYQALTFANLVDTPIVTTLHNALNPQPVKELFYRNAHLPYISISNYQQRLWPELNYAATVYHGIEMQRFNPDLKRQGKDYLAFLGRLSPEKGPQHAIRVAKELGMKLIMAGKIDRVDRIFYDKEIAHLVDGGEIQYIGEVNHDQKVELLRNAAATLCPVTWPEPFGLVMIESMACGTPVLALRDGSIPEVIDHGKTGYVAESVEELIEATRSWKRYDRRQVREIAERRFSVARMVDDHERLYENLAARTTHQEGTRRLGRSISCMQTLTPTRVAEIRRSATASTAAMAGVEGSAAVALTELKSVREEQLTTSGASKAKSLLSDRYTGP